MSEQLKALTDNMVYALDIGTRTIVGILAEREDERFKVLGVVSIAHRDRAMYDGQIHDIERVARTVHQVSEQLMAKTGYQLTDVAIAAAGRALKTEQVCVASVLDGSQNIDKTTIDALAVEGLQRAQEQLEAHSGEDALTYYCVGYSVIKYTIDGMVFDNPLAHQGRQLQLEMVATFLPHSVVNSLYTVIDKAGLNVTSLTLEPIAALQIAIPQKFRLLNIALVDIGAGTSDIALTRDGHIHAYGMVDVAGDELTEALVNAYLLDFDSAEALKVALCKQDKQSFSDIVGTSYKLSSEEIIKQIEPNIERIANMIGEAVIKANGQAPSAVFLVGGGCQMPKLRKHIAQSLNVAKERVVIKDVSTLEDIDYQDDVLIGPEYMTPLGIGKRAQQDQTGDFLRVTVNDKPVKLFKSKQLRVLDALVLLGFNAKSLLPKRGASLVVTINGQSRRIVGTSGEAAIVSINDKVISLDTAIQSGDRIKLQEAIGGEDAVATIADIVDLSTHVYYNKQRYDLITQLTVNGQAVSGDTALKTTDQINYQQIVTLQDFSRYADVAVETLLVNERVVASDYALQNGDQIALSKQAEQLVRSVGVPLPAQDNGLTTKPISRYTLMVNGDTVIIETTRSSLIFVDIFDHINFDLTRPQGIIDLKLNGRRASYTDVLQSGDEIEISWQ